MKTLDQLGISHAPWGIDYDTDSGVPYRVHCTRPRGLSNTVFNDVEVDGWCQEVHLYTAAQAVNAIAEIQKILGLKGANDE